MTSGLKHAARILDGVDGIAFCELGSADVVRHRLVARIVDAYSRYEAQEAARSAASAARGRRRGRASSTTSESLSGTA